MCQDRCDDECRFQIEKCFLTFLCSDEVLVSILFLVDFDQVLLFLRQLSQRFYFLEIVFYESSIEVCKFDEREHLFYRLENLSVNDDLHFFRVHSYVFRANDQF